MVDVDIKCHLGDESRLDPLPDKYDVDETFEPSAVLWKVEVVKV